MCSKVKVDWHKLYIFADAHSEKLPKMKGMIFQYIYSVHICL